MSLTDVIGNFRFRKVRLGRRTNYQLTALGKTRLEKSEGEGPNWNVLSYLDENQPSCTIREVSGGTHMDEEQVRIILGRLIQSGYVSKVAGE